MKKAAAALVIIFMATRLGCQTKQTKKEEHANVGKIPIVNFFRNPQKTGYKISPDGRFYAYRGPVKGIMNLFIKEMGGKEPAQMTFSKERDI